MYFHHVLSSFEYNGYNKVNATQVSGVDRSIVMFSKIILVFISIQLSRYSSDS